MSQAIEITGLLQAWGRGDQSALDRLMPVMYAELHRIASRYMRKEGAGNTLQTTALVNEAYLRLVDVKNTAWQDRGHFFALSAQIMRRILVDSARARVSAKRGAGKRVVHSTAVDFDAIPDPRSHKDADVIALDDAMSELEKLDPRKTRIVEMRFFLGLSVDESAEVLGVSPQTVLRDWKLAKAWLLRAMSQNTVGNR